MVRLILMVFQLKPFEFASYLLNLSYWNLAQDVHFGNIGITHSLLKNLLE